MKRIFVVAIFIAINAVAFAQVFRSKPQYEEIYADSMFYYISKAIPSGWSIKKYDRRLVISRIDSVYLQFDVPPNSPYYFDNDTTNGYRSYPKYKFQVYVDFPLENWTVSTWNNCIKHNDSINQLEEKVVTESRKVPVAQQMDEYSKNEARLNFLYAQLIMMPVAYTNWFGIYVSDNAPKGCMVLDTQMEGKGSSGYYKSIDKQIAELKATCVAVIKAHLNIQYKY